MDTYTCMAESLGCSPGNGTTFLTGCAPIKNALVLKKGKKKVMWSWIQLELIILREVSQKKQTNIIWCHLYVESKI